MFDKLKHNYEIFIQEKGDPRLKNFLLLDNLAFTVGASTLYVIAVKYVGPTIMKNKQPFQLKKVLFVYNALQIILSAYILKQLFEKEWFTTSRLWKCQPVDYTRNDNALRILKAFYMYYLSKFTEYLDTVFFVLRKKNNQISFLHLYHHASMPIWIWLIVKFYGGGSMTIIPLFNSFVHVVMYTYYLLAGLGPQVQKYLWWKKYITTLQLIQFLSGIAHFLFAVLDPSLKCNIPKFIILWLLFLGIFFYILFSNFYKKKYGKGSSEKSNGNLAKKGY